MKKYLVKKTYKAKRSNDSYEKGEVLIFYIGSKSVADPELCDYIKEYGWLRKHFAENYIKSDKEFYDRFGSDFWEINYEIIEVEIG